jgi:hypothetical protein
MTMHKIGLLKIEPAAWTDYLHTGLRAFWLTVY